eukprot:gene7809-8006_t
MNGSGTLSQKQVLTQIQAATAAAASAGGGTVQKKVQKKGIQDQMSAASPVNQTLQPTLAKRALPIVGLAPAGLNGVYEGPEEQGLPEHGQEVELPSYLQELLGHGQLDLGITTVDQWPAGVDSSQLEVFMLDAADGNAEAAGGLPAAAAASSRAGQPASDSCLAVDGLDPVSAKNASSPPLLLELHESSAVSAPKGQQQQQAAAGPDAGASDAQVADGNGMLTAQCLPAHRGHLSSSCQEKACGAHLRAAAADEAPEQQQQGRLHSDSQPLEHFAGQTTTFQQLMKQQEQHVSDKQGQHMPTKEAVLVSKASRYVPRFARRQQRYQQLADSVEQSAAAAAQAAATKVDDVTEEEAAGTQREVMATLMPVETARPKSASRAQQSSGHQDTFNTAAADNVFTAGRFNSLQDSNLRGYSSSYLLRALHSTGSSTNGGKVTRFRPATNPLALLKPEKLPVQQLYCLAGPDGPYQGGQVPRPGSAAARLVQKLLGVNNYEHYLEKCTALLPPPGVSSTQLAAQHQQQQQLVNASCRPPGGGAGQGRMECTTDAAMAAANASKVAAQDEDDGWLEDIDWDGTAAPKDAEEEEEDACGLCIVGLYDGTEELLQGQQHFQGKQQVPAAAPGLLSSAAASFARMDAKRRASWVAAAKQRQQHLYGRFIQLALHQQQQHAWGGEVGGGSTCWGTRGLMQLVADCVEEALQSTERHQQEAPKGTGVFGSNDDDSSVQQPATCSGP